MGHGVHAKCSDCGSKFTLHAGYGFNSYVLFCDQCGAAVLRQGSAPRSIEPSEAICACGGHLEMNERLARCPRCKSRNWSGEQTFLWD